MMIMKLFSTRVWIAWLLIPALAVALHAQSGSVSILKKYRDKDGNVVEEKITKSGDEADAFDVNSYVEKARKDDLVELNVTKVDSKGNQSNVIIQNGEKGKKSSGKVDRRVQRSRIQENPGEVIVLGEDVNGLPLPPNARGKNITIDVEGLDEIDEMDLDRQVRIRINKNGEIEERVINLDRALERSLDGLEEGLEEMEDELEDMEDALENLGNCKNKSRGNGYSNHWSEKTSDQTACLGVYPETVEGKKGARINSFTGYSPAEDAGMEEGDIITALDGQRVSDYTSLTQVLAEKQIGQSVKVSYNRDGKSQSAEVALKSCDGANNTACLGVYTDTYRQEGKKTGAQINDFARVSPARTSGLQEGDILLAINDRGVKSEEALVHVLALSKPGDEVKVKYQRNGKISTQTVVLKDCNDTKFPAGLDRRVNAIKDNCDDNDAFLGVVSSITIETTGDETSRTGESPQGLLVSSVTAGGPAALAGIQDGDIITSIDKMPIVSFDDLEAFMQNQKPGANVDVRFLREGKSEQRTVQLKSCKDRNARERVIISERGKGDRERRTIILRKPTETDVRVNEGPAQPIASDERSLNLTDFKAFPNPAGGKVTINFVAEAKPTVVSILDMSGRQIFNEELNTFIGNYSREFDLTEYSNATLIVRIAQGDKVYSDRIVVTK
jgi:S1-C subfamily serine protease